MASCLASSSLDTPPDTYLYTLASNLTHNAAIASDDSLRLFDSSLNLHASVRRANAGISSLATLGRGFATAGRDGKIQCWDPRTPQRAVSTFHLPPPTHGRVANSGGISALASTQSTGSEHVLAAGTASESEGLGDVSVLMYDTRQPGSQPIRNFSESHTDTITQLAFHPTEPSIILSASTDGLVSLFDLQQLEEEDALQQVLNPRSAVHCAAFLPGPYGAASEEVAVLTMDEQFAVYSLADEKREAEAAAATEATQVVKDFGDVRPTLGCTYVVGIDTTSRPDMLLVGDHNRQTLTAVLLERQSSLSNAGAAMWDFSVPVDFPGAHGEEVVRDFLVDRDSQRAMTCGEDGKVRVWSLP